jgi:hypothetical protein
VCLSLSLSLSLSLALALSLSPSLLVTRCMGHMARELMTQLAGVPSSTKEYQESWVVVCQRSRLWTSVKICEVWSKGHIWVSLSFWVWTFRRLWRTCLVSGTALGLHGQLSKTTMTRPTWPLCWLSLRLDVGCRLGVGKTHQISTEKPREDQLLDS